LIPFNLYHSQAIQAKLFISVTEQFLGPIREEKKKGGRGFTKKALISNLVGLNCVQNFQLASISDLVGLNCEQNFQLTCFDFRPCWLELWTKFSTHLLRFQTLLAWTMNKIFNSSPTIPIIMMSKPKSSRDQPPTQLKFWNYKVQSPNLAPNKIFPPKKKKKKTLAGLFTNQDHNQRNIHNPYTEFHKFLVFNTKQIYSTEDDWRELPEYLPYNCGKLERALEMMPEKKATQKGEWYPESHKSFRAFKQK
jgi:hypothetical protein